MDFELPGTSNAAEGEGTVTKIVEELSQEYGQNAFCTNCPSDLHYFPYRYVPESNLEGNLILTDYPFFGFVLRTDISDYFLILQNPMNIIASLLTNVGKKVSIKKGQRIIEYYNGLSKRFYPETFHLEFLELAENVELVEENDSDFLNFEDFEDGYLPNTSRDTLMSYNIRDEYFSSDSDLNFEDFEEGYLRTTSRGTFMSNNISNKYGSQNSVVISNEYWSQNILVLHVSTVLNIRGVTVCLLFIKFLQHNQLNEDMWLILQNKTCSWSVGLFPGLKYELLIPNSFQKDIFSKYKQHLRKILPIQFHACFEPIFHHQELFTTMNACYVPGSAKLKLLPQSSTSTINNALSVEEASSENNADLISIYGRVTKVNHMMRHWSPYCFMCSKVGTAEPKIDPLKSSEKSGLNLNSYRAEPKIPSKGIIFPESSSLPSLNERRTFGVLGSLIKKLTIKDPEGSDETLIFMRDHSFHTGLEKVDFRSGLLHDGGVLPNTVVRFENLIKKTPLGGKAYYLTTPLTKIIILERPRDNPEASWSSFCAPIGVEEWIPGKIFWFPLDFPDLVYVRILAVCENCEGQISENLCPSLCQTMSCKINATAFLMVEHVTEPPFKLILKNDHVKTFLGADDTMWNWFLTAAKRAPLIYRPEKLESVDLSSEEEFSVLFKFYCDLFRPKKMWHVSVKIMKPKPDEKFFLVFCLEMLPVDPARTAKFAYDSERIEDNANANS